MRIGLDVSPLARPHPPGVVRAVAGLARALEERGRLEIVRLAPEAGESLRSWRHKKLARLARELRLDGLHSTVSAFPLGAACPRVQTVHELPWRHGVRENAGVRHRLWVALGPLAAERVLCPSEHVARDVRRRILPGAARVRVVPWGCGAPFAPDTPLDEVDELRLVRYRLGEDPIALCVGAVRAKKNLAALLHGLAELVKRRGPRYQIVVTGPDTPDLRRDLGLAARLGLNRYVSTPGPIEETDLPALLRLSTVVPVLSRSEGFAFPVLEAMACGTPVIVPRHSAQSELAGPAGIEVEASDPSAVAEALARAHAERHALRAALLERAAQFTWERTAERVEALWKEIA
jgi:glycosyltransferase involved in cell wall biosynthesis